jgi:beta-lactamase class A
MKQNSKRSGWIKALVISLSIVAFISVVMNIYLFAKADCSKMSALQPLTEDQSCSLDVIREKSCSQKFVKPLLLADINSESDKFNSLKTSLTSLIEQKKQSEEILAATIYIRDLNTSSWAEIGDDCEYYPGSLMKVPIMLSYLKTEQEFPGTLKKEFLYEKPVKYFPAQVYPGDSILSGKRYSVATLLKYLIVESDNNANYALATHINHEFYKRLFTDLDVPYNDLDNGTYTITARNYSKFFRVLYSSTYLNEDLSNYALRLLVESTFKSGMVKDLPFSTVVAHKFGEKGVHKGEVDFSESGIVFYQSKPYLLTIMTRGKDVKRLASVVREFSAEVYKQYKNI